MLERNDEMNKERRRWQTEKYLDAETNVREEQKLVAWYAAHAVEADEEDVARLVVAEHPEAVYDVDGHEFDIIMARSRRRVRALWWACGTAACIVLAAGLWFAFPKHDTCPMSGQEMLQGIESIMSLGMEDVESITARPQGGKVVITVVQTDGSECHYLMSKDRETAAITITAKRGNQSSNYQ